MNPTLISQTSVLPHAAIAVSARGALALLCLGVTIVAGESAVVTEATEAALRAAMINGGAVQFACDGTITLANPIAVISSTSLDGAGHEVTISGGNAVRVFQVRNDVMFTLANLSIANGLGTNGGGLYSEGGRVTITNCTFRANAARQATISPVPSAGGAIFNEGGELILQRCLFTNNSAWGGQQGVIYVAGCDGAGGAVYSTGALRANGCTFAQNEARGGNAAGNTSSAGGIARGGAVCSAGSMLLEGDLFVDNSAVGGVGGNGSPGTFVPPYLPGGNGGAGGDAYGGAVCSSGAGQIINCTVAQNFTKGERGGNGGNGPWGGGGGTGGDALGALWCDTALTSLTNCTLALNISAAGAGGNPGEGVPPGFPGPAGSATGGLAGQNLRLVNTLLADNVPGNGGNTLTDLGHNLSSDSSIALTGAGSITNADPELGPLADNGGPTLTMELLPGSPAIDTADTLSAPAHDQRGVPRPVGSAADIGAFEFVTASPVITRPPASQTTPIGTDVEFTVEATGSPQLKYQWLFNLTNSLSHRTNALLRLTNVQPADAGNYRVVVTNLFGSVTSPPALLTVSPVPPTFVVSPSNQTVALESSVTFSAAATGSLPMVYQWFFNATNELSHATGPSLTLTNVQLSDAGAYTIRASNAFGAITSAPAMLILFGVPPAIVASPPNEAAVLGSAVDFSVNASGSPPLIYQWMLNGTNLISVGPDPVLHIAAVQYAHAGWYSAIVTNPYGFATSVPALLTVTPPGTTAVANPTEAEVRAALAVGGRVVFACDGVITLTGTLYVTNDTILDGAGHDVTISGAGAGRVFQVNPGVTFALANVTVANGCDALGGALRSLGGSVVRLTNCVFSGNCAVGAAGSAVGEGGSAGSGGAVFNTGNFFATRCFFAANHAEGGDGRAGSDASVAPPIAAGSGAAGSGGAIYNLGSMILESTLLASNSASGGDGGMGASGNYYVSPDAGATGGGQGGAGAGAALYNAGTAVLLNCSLAWNHGNGGGGGQGGAKSGPIPYVTFGAPGGSGGNGVGGIFTSNGQLSLTNCTAVWNSGSGGLGGSGGMGNLQARGGDGGGGGGGIAAEAPPPNLVNSLFAFNIGTGARGGYGILNGDRYNPVYGYSPTGYSNGNLRGVVVDVGYNLSSDAGTGLTNNTSLNNTDPKLASLADNGGSTLTVMLSPDSPAVDAGDPACAPPLDQRGYPRTFGTAPDIGAVEYWPARPFLLISQPSAGEVRILAATGIPGQSCRLLASSNLSDWVPVATNQVGTDGMAVFSEPVTPRRFYRVAVP